MTDVNNGLFYVRFPSAAGGVAPLLPSLAAHISFSDVAEVPVLGVEDTADAGPASAWPKVFPARASRPQFFDYVLAIGLGCRRQSYEIWKGIYGRLCRTLFQRTVIGTSDDPDWH